MMFKILTCECGQGASNFEYCDDASCWYKVLYCHNCGGYDSYPLESLTDPLVEPDAAAVDLQEEEAEENNYEWKYML